MNYQSTKSSKGQALIESVFVIVFSLFLLAVVFEGARYASLLLRVASSTREGGRLYVLQNIIPNASLSYNQNKTNLTTQIQTAVWVPIQQMVEPADLQNKGVVIVSILKRIDPDDDNDDASTTQTDKDSDDKIIVEYQFIYPTGTSLSYTSKLGTAQGNVNESTAVALSDSVLSKDALNTNERTVAIEIYHQTDMIFGGLQLPWISDQKLTAKAFDSIYDMAIF